MTSEIRSSKCVVGLWFRLLVCAGIFAGEFTHASFQEGVEAYGAGQFADAAVLFGEAARTHPSSGAWQNLGNAEWQRGGVGPAIVAWERSVWIDSSNQAARNDLKFARETAQVPAPELNWYETASAWLPVNWWAWIAGASLWLAVGMVTLPVVFRWKYSTWPQAVAASGLAVFLLCIPAHIGVQTRSRIGFILQRDTPLRLTPTAEGEEATRLGAGEPGRLKRIRGDCLFIRTHRGAGWVKRSEFELVCAGY